MPDAPSGSQLERSKEVFVDPRGLIYLVDRNRCRGFWSGFSAADDEQGYGGQGLGACLNLGSVRGQSCARIELPHPPGRRGGAGGALKRRHADSG
jgi:hypothetical protein